MDSIERREDAHQLTAWQDLIESLEQVSVSWKTLQLIGTDAAASSQLPGNVAVALVNATHQATQAIAGITDVLVEQYDNDSFQHIGYALRQALSRWPAR